MKLYMLMNDSVNTIAWKAVFSLLLSSLCYNKNTNFYGTDWWYASGRFTHSAFAGVCCTTQYNYYLILQHKHGRVGKSFCETRHAMYIRKLSYKQQTRYLLVLVFFLCTHICCLFRWFYIVDIMILDINVKVYIWIHLFTAITHRKIIFC